MMNPVVENLNLSFETLISIEKKIESNTATTHDYAQLESFLTSVGLSSSYILDHLKNENIYSYDQFINERKKPFELRNRAVDGRLLGFFLGVIMALKDYIIKNDLR